MSNFKHKSTQLRTLNARPGHFSDFVIDMKRATLDYRHPDGKFKGQNPLAEVDLSDHGNFLNGLYHSWAAVLEVLSFYQEKIAQEGYLKTATESFSVEQLVAEIGYQRPHALSAKTWLAFTLSQDSQRLQYVIPKGTRAQNIPQGGQPITFETIETFVGKPDWNTLNLAQSESSVSSRSLLTSSSFCHVVKPAFMIKKHAHIWISGTLNEKTINFFVVIQEIIKLKEGGVLLIWHSALAPNQTGQIQNPQLVLMPKTYAILGHDALDWSSLPFKEQSKYTQHFSSIAVRDKALTSTWQDVVQYPQMTVHAMVSLLSGKLLAVGSKGMFYSLDEGETWLKVNNVRVDITLLCITFHDGVIYTGGSQGYLLSSYDEAKTWNVIRGNRPLDKEAKKHSMPGLLPAVTITSLTAITLNYRDGGKRHILFVGTMKGLYYSTDEGRYWMMGNGLFHYHNESLPEGAQVHDLQTDGEWVVASTSLGLYFAKVDTHSLEEKGEEVKNTVPSFLSKYFLFESQNEKRWSQHNRDTQVYAAINIETDKGRSTLFATHDEVYQLLGGELVTVSEGILRTLDRCIPRVHGFLPLQDTIYMATDLGVYVAKKSTYHWQLDSLTHLYTLPNPKCWETALTEGQLPDDGADNLLLFGFPLSDAATVKTGDKDGLWLIEEPNAASIYIQKKQNSLVLTTGGWVDNQGALLVPISSKLNSEPNSELNGESNSELNSELNSVPNSEPESQSVEQCEQVTNIGVLQSITDALSVLVHGQAVSPIWHNIFEHIGFKISQKAKVVTQVEKVSWLIQDDTQQIDFFITFNDEKVQISRLGSACSMLALPTGCLLYGGKPQSVLPSRWPDFLLRDNLLPLSTKKASISAGDTLLLKQSSPRGIQKQVTAVSVFEGTQTALGKMAVVTQVKTQKAKLAQFDRRTTRVFAGNFPLELSPTAVKTQVLQGDSIFTFKGKFTPLPSGHKVAIVGKRALLQLSQVPMKDASAPWVLKGATHDGQEVVLSRKKVFSFTPQAQEEAALMTPVLTAALIKRFVSKGIVLDDSAHLQVAGAEYWLLTQALGEYYYLQLDCDAKKVNVYAEYAYPIIEITPKTWVIAANETLVVQKNQGISVCWLKADKASGQCSELLEVSECDDLEQGMSIRWTSPLIHYFDASTVQLFANIVPAVHGETVQKELIAATALGQPFQRYQLHRSPLTFYQDDNGELQHFLAIEMRLSGSRERRSSVIEKWQQTSAILHSNSHQRHYEVNINGQGKTEILFGDGIHGRIPQAGIENVFAHYRFGGGAKGNLAAGEIKLLRNKPLGVKSVFNPLPCVGGADPVVTGSIRDKAPQSLHFQNVIISSDDCLQHARQYAGVSQATLTSLMDEHLPIWVICIETADLPIKEKQQLAMALNASINAILSHPVKVKVVLARVRVFRVSAQVWVKNLATCPNIADELSQSLADHYLNDRHNLGKDIDVAHVTAQLQAHSGVSGVLVTELGFESRDSADNGNTDSNDSLVDESRVNASKGNGNTDGNDSLVDDKIDGKNTVQANKNKVMPLLPASAVIVRSNGEILGAERLLTKKTLVSISLGAGS
ncbi:hypothetical protein [uncultured Shewanella sp.]|uniref:hypothetical protein n=1 Tax=uncultured Shewanella sp. TaxID=173975 RepID=UPI002621AEB2|nr:hypothetical protein [uncultured Shewanella sp.]